MSQKKALLKSVFIIFAVTTLSALLAFSAHAATGGVEDLLVDFSDYLTSRIIPATGVLGVITGGAMMSIGNENGINVIKYSIIGSAIGIGGAKTISSLFF